jgi:hypothetical protein
MSHGDFKDATMDGAVFELPLKTLAQNCPRERGTPTIQSALDHAF